MQSSNLRMIHCPICGGNGTTRTDWESERINSSYGIIAVCRSCGARTPARYCLEDAIAEWNEGNISKDGQNLRMSLFEEAA